jgi:hypothetical protein
MKTFWLVLAFVLILVAGLAVPKCHASGVTDPPYVQLGVGSAVFRGPAAIASLDFAVPASVLRNAYWQFGFSFMNQSTYKGINAPVNSFWRALFVDGFGHFDLGLGPGYVFNPAPYNGSHLNFSLLLDYRFTRLPITISYNHFSNGGEQSPNLGRDIIEIGYRFH